MEILPSSRRGPSQSLDAAGQSAFPSEWICNLRFGFLLGIEPRLTLVGGGGGVDGALGIETGASGAARGGGGRELEGGGTSFPALIASD